MSATGPPGAPPPEVNPGAASPTPEVNPGAAAPVPAARPGRFGADRFAVTYTLCGSDDAARSRAADICIEQSVEFPPDLVHDGEIRATIFGRIESLRCVADERHDLVVSYAVDSALPASRGADLVQLLNVLFGNTSLQPGVRLERFVLPASMIARFRGPRYGRPGLRALLGAPWRPLVCTALKPMGLDPQALAELAYQFARGGADLVKDDHGLADQPFCPFEERVSACAAAIARANQETGQRCLYVPNVSGPHETLAARVRFARRAGAGGLMLAPGLVGFDALRQVAADDEVALPLLMHPALLGTFLTTPETGIGPFALYGQLARLAGADGVIFPSHGGRFTFGAEDCRAAVAGMSAPLGGLPPIFPVPAGGMSLARVPELCAFYGADAIYLIGGDLHRHGPDLAASCRTFRDRTAAACRT